MIDLSTSYGGLKLKNPLVVGSSGLTDNIESLVELEKAGAGAVVLKSLFEEEILRDMKIQLKTMNSSGYIYPETLEFYDYFDGPKETTTSYLELIAEAKKNLKIPVIASINCLDADNWTYFPGRIEETGVDALEINIFNLPTDLNKTSQENEKIYFDIISEAKKQVQLPIFIKLSYYASSLAAFLVKISQTKIDGLVLFNRFYNPDIDIETLELNSGAILSSPGDIFHTLRWIAILSERVDCSLIASTGIHDASGVIKQILAGAKAVQMVSAFYKNGIMYLKKVLSDLEEWMKKKNYNSLDDFRGILSQAKSSNPAVYSRVQFMKYYRGFSQ
jgi:dihydroorotate dehydrogenase (fumarate)